MRNLIVLMALILTFGQVLVAQNVFAQPSATEMLEQARARAREMEELKKVLNGSDQNMRLATFDIMANSGDSAMRAIAIDTGLASADSLMQAMAFKEAILALDRLVFTLEVDKDQPDSIQEIAQKILDGLGNQYIIPIIEVDKKTGVFKIKSSYKGQVSGNTVNFQSGYDKGTLTLQDESSIKGKITVYKNGYGGFVATAKIR